MSDDQISRVDVPPLGTLPADLQERLNAYLDKPGFIPNVLRAYALRPSKLRAFMDHYDELMLGDSDLSKAEREMIAVTVSSINHCFYCLASHGAALRLRTKNPSWPKTSPPTTAAPTSHPASAPCSTLPPTLRSTR